ncbi:protein of unknown function [Methylocaldum szegediense]|uniref:Uncharacterized protein n=1 Tax=Methylocaldum szegediense TaxID=73780 RepID=A0ABM9I6A8_9GAMM|nr:protein of unknown function [Methylocaldum szegediense]
MRRSLFQDPFDIFDEAHAQHLVGFVEDQGGQVVQRQGSAAKMIHHPARRADDDVHAPGKLPQLGTHALAAVNGQDVKAIEVAGIGLKGFGNLNGEFAGWGEHQGLGYAPGQIDSRQYGNREGRGFTGAGLRLAQQILPLQEMRDALGLNGRWGFVTDFSERPQDGLGDGQLFEGGY